MANTDFKKLYKIYEKQQTHDREHIVSENYGRGSQINYAPDEAPDGLGYSKGSIPTVGTGYNQTGTSAPNIYSSDEEHQKINISELRSRIHDEIITAENEGQQYTILILSKLLKLI
jgi:hypothetical protein